MKNQNLIKKIILSIVIIVVLFLLFRTTKLTITYDGLNENAVSYGTRSFSPMYKAAGSTADMSISNMMSAEAVYDGSINEESGESSERYRENKYYRVDTEKFDTLVEKLTNVIKEKNGVIKINNQSSNKKTYYGKEFYPRYQQIEFTVDNSEVDLSVIEDTLKEYGNIRISNSNITSIEQELTNYEQRLKEIEEARKALQESKDKDWIANRQASLAKESERIKNQIENAKKESTYKTYNIDVYEVLYLNVNSIKHWYSNNYDLQDTVKKVLPYMITLFAILIPVVSMLLIFIYLLLKILKTNKKIDFEEKIEMIKKLDDKEIHFDIKM